MPLKSSYEREGRRWLPISRAAELLATNAARIKKLMASGELEWIPLRSGSKTFLVDQAKIFALRQEWHVARKETARRAQAATRSAKERGASLNSFSRPVPLGDGRGRPSVYERTWDPSPYEPPIAGRDKTDR